MVNEMSKGSQKGTNNDVINGMECKKKCMVMDVRHVIILQYIQILNRVVV